MIRNDLLSQLQRLIKTSAPPLIHAAQAPVVEIPWASGQHLTAVVLASLPNGRFQVQVGDIALDMNLPNNTQPGDAVELTFISNQPRLTFALTRDLPDSVGGNLPFDEKPQVTLSDSVRYLGALLRKISDQTDAPATAPSKTAPLLSAAPTHIGEFANALRNALSQSGMFYESHQAQWVAGDRPLADLLQEPQGKLPTLNPAAQAEIGRTDASVTKPSDGPTAQTVAQGTSSMPVHSEAVALVQQQLQTLDSRQLVWQGQVWPGQPMEWQVEERNARDRAPEVTEAADWQTRMRLQLPKLGDVQATLVFAPQGLRIDLKVTNADTAEAMRGSQAKLQSALTAAGLKVLAMSVARHEKI